MAAGLLAILLGSFGVHAFYLGNTKKGVIYLLITILSCGFLAIIPSILGIIEGIYILTDKETTDAYGIPLTQ
jgi:TM2 domain-containing membrane protein YozV